jgi:predicted metalloprotease with PDZ domain
VDLFPLAPSSGKSTGGSARHDAFSFFATPNVEEADLLTTFAHEHTHSWIPRRVGRMPDEPTEAADYWLSEGFTDFYAARTLLRSGLWSPQTFIDFANGVLLAYAVSPVKEIPNARLADEFWKDPNVQKLPYQRGFLLAFVWDAEMRRATGGAAGLDSVLFNMRDRYVAAPMDAKPDIVENFIAASRAMTGFDPTADLQTYVGSGRRIFLPEDLFGDCAIIKTSTIANFDLGYDRRATAASDVFAGVDPHGPAYRAGLRDGMKRLGRTGGREGDSRVEIQYRIRDQQGAERTIAYQPAGGSPVKIQEISLARAGDTPAATSCTARFSGD